jgi:hypothetical protein
MLCPFCGANHDCHAGIGEAAHLEPSDGDASLCFRCGRLAIFELGQLRRPTAAEQDELDQSVEIQRVCETWRAMRRGYA